MRFFFVRHGVGNATLSLFTDWDKAKKFAASKKGSEIFELRGADIVKCEG